MKTFTMKTTFLAATLAFFSITFSAKAQTIPNGNFENWTNKFMFEEPALYTTSNSQAYLSGISLPITKSTDKVSGSFAVKLETIASANDTMPAFLFLGTPGNQTINGGYPFNNRPDSVSFFAKHNQKTNDTGVFIVFFKKNGAMIGLVREAFTGTQASYKNFKSPVYWFSGQTPDTMAVLISSSNLDGKKYPGSNLYVDSAKFFSKGGATFPFPNGNFESWKSYSSDEPDNWYSLNFATVNMPMVTKTTDKNNGTYAVRIENVYMKFGNVMGFISNGKIGMDDKPSGGMAINLNPLKVSGYYKYIPKGPDTAIAGIFLYRYDAVKKKSILIEDTIIKLKAAATYTYFEVPILYNNKPFADTLNISFAASNVDDTTAFVGLGSVLFIDNLSISYKPNSITQVENKIFVRIYPNPFGTSATLSIEDSKFNTSGAEFVLFDLSGREVLRKELTENKTEINRDGLTRGIYFYQIKNGLNEIYATGRMSVD